MRRFTKDAMKQKDTPFSGILFYGILNYTTDTIEFVSDLMQSNNLRMPHYNIERLTSDDLVRTCLMFAQIDGKKDLEADFNRKSALSLYGSGARIKDVDVWVLNKENQRKRARIRLMMERDPLSGHIKGFFYIYESTAPIRRKLRAVQPAHEEPFHCLIAEKKASCKREFDRKLDEMVEAGLRDYALIYMDIKNFEDIKSFLSYQDSMKIVDMTAEIIRGNLKETEGYCNVYCSSFFILLEYPGKEQLEERLQQMNSLITGFKKFAGGTKISAILTHGITILKAGQVSEAAQFTKQAVVAQNLCRPLHLGELAVSYFDEEMRDKLLREKYIETNMLEALQAGNFEICLQPKFNISKNQIVGAEALARWNDNGTLIYPAEFIPLFEANNSIVELDLFIFNEVCSKIRKWLDAGKTPLPISVNISKVHLHKREFLKRYLKILKVHNVPPSLIELELTESILAENPQILLSAVEDIHKAGMKCALDDFGAGYSSLNMIKDLEVDTVKLDRAFFLYDAAHEKKAKIVIETICRLAKGLSMQVIAEGVETQAQLDFLKHCDCMVVQCYLLSTPLTIDAFEKLVFPAKKVQKAVMI